MIICFGHVVSWKNVSELLMLPISKKAMVYINANKWINKLRKDLNEYE